MSYAERQSLYTRIEQLRGRPLVAYVTSSRTGPAATGQMAPDVIPHFIKQLVAIPNDCEEIDILIVSNGGDPIVAWRIISMLRDRFKKVGALLPYAAYSAATLLILGADEIVMHPFSNLGPVDPQLTHTRRVPGAPGVQDSIETIHFGSEDLRYFLDFVRADVGISDQQELEKAFELVCKEVGAIPIGVAKRSSQLSLSMGEKLLRLHLQDDGQSRAIAEALNRAYYHHGYPLGMSEAAKIGLPVIKAQDELQDALWQVWQDIEDEMECNAPFDPLAIVMNNKTVADILNTIHQVQIPSNLPSQMLEAVYNQVLQQIRTVQIPTVVYNLFQAMVESPRAYSQFRTSGNIAATRHPQLNLIVNLTPTASGWSFKTAQETKEN